MTMGKWILTIAVLAGEELERLIKENDRQRNFKDGDPFFQSKRANLEDGRKDVHVEDHEVEGHRKTDGRNEPNVRPWWHHQHRLVLRQAVQGIQHLDSHQDGQGHRHGVRIVEDAAINILQQKITQQIERWDIHKRVPTKQFHYKLTLKASLSGVHCKWWLS